MNLRISDNQLRFRITREEVAQLLEGNSPSISVDLGSASMRYGVSLSDATQPLALELEESCWRLHVNRQDFKSLAASLPSRDGIEHEVHLGGKPVTLILEVDVRRAS